MLAYLYPNRSWVSSVEVQGAKFHWRGCILRGLVGVSRNLILDGDFREGSIVYKALTID